MRNQHFPFNHDIAVYAQSRLHGRYKRRLAKEILARGERLRRLLIGAMVSGVTAAAIATGVAFSEYAAFL